MVSRATCRLFVMFIPAVVALSATGGEVAQAENVKDPAFLQYWCGSSDYTATTGHISITNMDVTAECKNLGAPGNDWHLLCKGTPSKTSTVNIDCPAPDNDVDSWDVWLSYKLNVPSQFSTILNGGGYHKTNDGSYVRTLEACTTLLLVGKNGKNNTSPLCDDLYGGQGKTFRYPVICCAKPRQKARAPRTTNAIKPY